MFQIKWGKRCFFWKLNWLVKKERDLLTIIWDHRKWHIHKNPVRKPKEMPVAGESTYPVAGE